MLARQKPFAGRAILFGGDDTTDLDVFRILPRLGGRGFSVGKHFPGAEHVFRIPARGAANGWRGWPRRARHDRRRQTVDLAVIGNGRIAALVNTQGQLVWWCFPRFDSDPVFSRLIAGDEEKGFCDVVLDRQVERHSAL